MITVRTEGLDTVLRQLRQIPGAVGRGVANGINRTMAAVEQHQLVEIERTIDRPTPFTMSAIGWRRASEKRLEASLYIKPIQARYLRIPIEGGTIAKMIVPIKKNVRLDRYGNIPGKVEGLSKIAKRLGGFVAEINGVTGVWKKHRGGKTRLLVMVAQSVKRQKRYDFYGVGRRVIDARLANDLAEEIQAESRR